MFQALTTPWISFARFSMTSRRKISTSVIRPGVFDESTRMWPWGAALPLESHGSHVTAASTFSATNAAPASPCFMLTT